MADLSFIGNRFHSLDYEGILIEPGCLAAEYSVNKEATHSFLIHPLNLVRYAMRRAGLDPSRVPYWTYGNEVSLRQYHRMGFRQLGSKGFVLDGVSGNYVWNPMSATYGDLENYLNEIEKKRSGWTMEERQKLLQMFNSLEAFYYQSHPLSVKKQCSVSNKISMQDAI